jgi:sucrose-6-phosphate hydrolase SacC (GH32 family)
MQVAVPCYDTVLPNLKGTTIVIAKPPENPRSDLNLTADFRDPNVFKGPGGFFYMTLGSKDLNGKGGVVLLYRTKEPRLESEWIYLVSF